MGADNTDPQICTDISTIDVLSSLNKLIATHIVKIDSPRGHKLLQHGSIPNYLYYLHRGSVLCYSHHFTSKYLTSIWQPRDIILPKAMLDQTPSDETIVLLTDCKLSALSYASIQKIIATNVEAAGMFQVLLNRLLNVSLSVTEDLKRKTALDRYRDFTETFKGIEHLLPQHQVACYLGIKPQSLSRIRKTLQLKERIQSACKIATENTF